MSVAECTRCVMTASVDPDLVVVDGICHHCRRYDALTSSRMVPPEERGWRLNALVKNIRDAGTGNDYDCLIGVSGGVDSSFVALKVKELGLRPLAVHVDNGWNSALAVTNIRRVLETLQIDLVTEVLNLEEFYDLQRSFLIASVPDADIPADHAIQATLWKYARKFRISHVISGMNFATESISVPAWSYGHSDWRYISDVHRKHGQVPLSTYPHFGFGTLGWTNVVRRVRIASILNYMDYNKGRAIATLSEDLGWTPYEGKHYESIYTRWIQGVYLPEKFGFDKRRGHYSDLINSGQITREYALSILEVSDYPERLRRLDEELICKKLSLSRLDLDRILSAQARTFRDYKNSYSTVQFLRRSANQMRKRGLYPK